MEQLPKSNANKSNPITYTPPTEPMEWVIDSEGKFYNKNSLYLNTGYLSYQSVRTMIDMIIARAVKVLKKDGKFATDHFVKLNIPINKYGETFGFAYVFITNKHIHNVILGRNPDGTEMVKLVEIKNEKYDENEWGDQEFVSTKVPLLPSIGKYSKNYDSAELNTQREHFKAKNNRYPNEDEMHYSQDLGVNKAPIYAVDEKFQDNVLISTGLPPWITEAIIREELKHYCVSSPNLDIKLISPPKSMKTVFVTFCENSTDAAFALQMIKRLTIVSGNNKFDAYFTHASVKFEDEEDTRYPPTNGYSRGGRGGNSAPRGRQDNTRGGYRGGNSAPRGRADTTAPSRGNNTDEGFSTRGKWKR